MIIKKLNSDAERASSSFKKSMDILKNATSLLAPTFLSDESKNRMVTFRKSSQRLNDLLEKGLTAETIDKIDKEAHSIVMQCLSLQRATLKFRAGK